MKDERPFKSCSLSDRDPRNAHLTRVIVRHSWDQRESIVVDEGEAEVVVFGWWVEFHRKVLGFTPSWKAWAC